MDDIELFLVALVVFLGDFATYILNFFFELADPHLQTDFRVGPKFNFFSFQIIKKLSASRTQNAILFGLNLLVVLQVP